MFSLTLLIFPLIALCEETAQPKFILIPFITKSIRKDEDNEDWTEDYMWENYTDQQKEPTYNCSNMISDWFYSGLYTKIELPKKQDDTNHNFLQIFFSTDDSTFSLTNCKKVRRPDTSTKTTITKSENFIQKSLEDKGKSYTVGSAVFEFNSDLRYKEKVKVEENNGLSFIIDPFDEKFGDSDVMCGNIGLDLVNEKLENTLGTNFVEQLKKKNIVDKYIWTLKYQTPQDGIIIVGNEPHFHDGDSYYWSQYRKIYISPSTNTDHTSWSFSFDTISIEGKDENNKQMKSLNDKKVELTIDKGVIVGTEEYKKAIDEIFFTYYFNEKICFSETVSYKNPYTKKTNDYIIYYCNKLLFAGSNGKWSYSLDNPKPFGKFPSIEFFHKTFNYTFTLDKMSLFEDRGDRIYFMIVFEKSSNNNQIWKLGEPFLSKFQFVFDQDQKTLGFYNSNLPRIPNSEYVPEEEKGNGEKTHLNNGGNKALYIILIIVLVLAFSAVAYFLGKKLNEKRKKKANELSDDDYAYEGSINPDEANGQVN